MADVDFYALGDDLRRLFDFLYSETDVVVYELSSEPGRDPRRFDSVAELAGAYDLGAYRAGYLQLWSPSIMARPVFRRVEIKSPENAFRYEVGGAGLMQLYLDGIREGVIYCDWHALAKLSGRIRRHIRGRLAAAKLHARPVLHQALTMVQQGNGLWFGPAIHRADSANIERIV